MQLPVEFETRMKSMLGTEGYAAFSASLNHPAQSAFRPNKAKGAQSADHLESVPWSSTGKYLCQRPAFTFDPLFHAGVYYVQEPSSMFIEQALHSIDNPCRVLDLCASPGGKSTLLRSLLPDNVLLVCNEPIKLRAQVLLENMLKWGHSSVIVTNNYPKDFARLTGFFDVIAADVPCSGEGMFRKDNPAISEWSPANVSACAERQMEIVRDVWPALTDGGYLIYSTCTYNPDENERNVERICKELEAEAVEIPVNESWGITGNLLTGASFPAYHFLPSRTRGEGFFLALIRKKGGKQVYDTRLKKQEALAPLKKVLNKMLDDNDGWLQWEKEDLTFALHDCMATGFQQLAAVCHILSAGIPLATH